MVTGEDHAGHAQLQIAQALAREVQEVREVRDAADERRLAGDGHLPGGLVSEDGVVELALHVVCHDALTNLREAILLVEVQRLVGWKCQENSFSLFRIDENSAVL